MTRRRRPGEASEHQVQATFFQLVELHASRSHLLRLMYAIPNGGHRSKATAGRLKAEGVRPGVPDVHLPVRSGDGRYIGLWIEFKRPWNDLAAEQVTRIRLLREAGHFVAVCHEAEQAWAVVVDYLTQPVSGHALEHTQAQGEEAEHAGEAEAEQGVGQHRIA